MDPGLIVQEVSGEELGRFPPMEPQIVSGKGDEHRAHAKVDPSVVMQIAHARVDHGVACLALAPGLEAFVREFVFTQTIVGAAKVFKFQLRLVFEFLHEMAVPG